MVTLFQLWTYLEANGISDMEEHIIELAEEGISLTHTLTQRQANAETACNKQ